MIGGGGGRNEHDVIKKWISPTRVFDNDIKRYDSTINISIHNNILTTQHIHYDKEMMTFLVVHVTFRPITSVTRKYEKLICQIIT